MSENPTKPDHLCVLVHGLWGNPSHMDSVAAALRERHGNDRIEILCAKSNNGNYTYDGIELGGERLAHEIEETLETMNKNGQEIRKLSIIGYSLGGLVSRYAIGLLHAHGWFEKVEPVNFTTFATPHVGVRTPLMGMRGYFFNVLGAKTISMSGQQLFMVDSFRDTGRPLLAVLAEPQSVFIQGLKKFPSRCAYANIVNDRAVAFYTSALAKVDPFQDLGNININYVKDYDDVIINRDEYLLPENPNESTISRLWKRAKAIVSQVPIFVLLVLLAPIVALVFLLNALIQTIRSRNRIHLHETGKNGVRFGRYRIPLLMQNAQHAIEEVYEHANAQQAPAYLSSADDENSEKVKSVSEEDGILPAEAQAEEHTHRFPKLALTPEQFAIIDSLNDVGIHRYPVHIQRHRHSHAAIIVRKPKTGFWEGKVVMKHWLDTEFVL
ncbi:hypothetical protein N7492_008562 [Penicillium capsulatum]|uniref:DUF676 domain-containing protein n=1 Tax=Penicillium capsulatum TaxID=69766 RepID=A0A9W9LGW4_9EURO|nr:hypothetical protein N7492_008562 [Penicillium capsulatum]KAJ6105968.1 hypothetical protein N7512_009485 [Penicillium capsulatum]